MDRESPSRLERSLLVHLLEHRGAELRFEADQWTTEFGIARAFAQEDPSEVKGTLRNLEMERYVYRRVQYVIGYSEPKPVFSLTPTGYHLALVFHRTQKGPGASEEAAGPEPNGHPRQDNQDSGPATTGSDPSGTTA
jgi:hypothetical protein